MTQDENNPVNGRSGREAKDEAAGAKTDGGQTARVVGAGVRGDAISAASGGERVENGGVGNVDDENVDGSDDDGAAVALVSSDAVTDPGSAGTVTSMTPVIPLQSNDPATSPPRPGSTAAEVLTTAVPSAADPSREPLYAAAAGGEPTGSIPAVPESARASRSAQAGSAQAGSGKNLRDNVGSDRHRRDQPRSARRGREDGPEPAAALTADRLLNPAAAPPAGGWRLWLYKLTFGSLHVGDSDKVRVQRAREHRISARLGHHTRYVPVLSRKGGVGKTTVTTLLGMALAELREDRVIAMDANPDRGTLSDRSPGRADFTARQLVQDRFSVNTFSQLSTYVARDGSRLDVLASDTDPAVAQAFDDSDYRAVTDILGRYYSIVLTDSGTGMVHSVMKGTLEKADAVVLVSGGSVDEARLASETLSWLEAHGRHDLVAKAIVVINMSSGDSTQVNIGEIEDHFRSRVSHVLRIPYDRHLAEGSRVRLDELRPATRAAAMELAALVVDELQAG
ncbi:MinD/ParA family ATP-binding protein [Arthrobacter sp. A5]|uniref:MinD/ParA family ATP-binding protein n=1 Tax=Arthrobacter sp. A5 TaxID=576926 RepID=UPI003DA88E86